MREEGYAEGEGWGFDLLQKKPMYSREWIVDGDGERIRQWFREELITRGWNSTRVGEIDVVTMDVYMRGTEELTIRLFGRAADAPPWLYWPRGERDDPGLLFEVMLVEHG